MRSARNGSDLGRLPLFQGCSKRELRDLARLGTRVRVPATTRLMTEDGMGTDVVIVVSGMATCTMRGEPVALFGPGDLFGEVAALDGRRRTATVTAVSDMEVVILDRVEFDVLLISWPDVARRVLEATGRRLRSADDRAAA